mgnify:CR=1 FL=1
MHIFMKTPPILHMMTQPTATNTTGRSTTTMKLFHMWGCYWNCKKNTNETRHNTNNSCYMHVYIIKNSNKIKWKARWRCQKLESFCFLLICIHVAIVKKMKRKQKRKKFIYHIGVALFLTQYIYIFLLWSNGRRNPPHIFHVYIHLP